MAEVEQTGPLSKPCPGCGVHMPLGYVKCPRCHTVLPPTQPGAGRSRPTTDMGGGTAVAGMDRTLIYIGVGAIVLIALVTWLLTRGGDDGAKPAPPAEGSDETVDDTATNDPGVEPPEAPPDCPSGQPAPPPDEPAGPNPGAAIAELGTALRVERLWASVSADGATVVIQSSFCDDGGLSSIVDGHAGELRDARFTAVRCRAPHGAVVFEHPL